MMPTALELLLEEAARLARSEPELTPYGVADRVLAIAGCDLELVRRSLRLTTPENDGGPAR
jgi:hypothetical protein